MTYRNNSKTVSVKLKAPGSQYDIIIGRGTLDRVGSATCSLLGEQARRAVLISNRKVFALYGKRVTSSLRKSGFKVESFLIGDGERHKSLWTLQRALSFLATVGLERSAAIVALGGGVVGDLAGLTAALYLRGVALIQVPTTLLAEIDASVGGKTVVNLPQGKNLVGVFHQPRAVFIDTETLRTLSKRELTAGWCEAVKQGAVGSRKLFDKAHRLLAGGSTVANYEDQLSCSIAAQCRFKAGIVAGDERENLDRTDYRSRRILNFGHTVGHSLEAVTRYRRFKHGEAVGHGMLVAGEISRRIGLLKDSGLGRLRETIQSCGRLPRANDLEPYAIIKALRGDKKSIGGKIKWVLLEEIGKARIVDEDYVSPRLLRASLGAALRG